MVRIVLTQYRQLYIIAHRKGKDSTLGRKCIDKYKCKILEIINHPIFRHIVEEYGVRPRTTYSSISGLDPFISKDMMSILLFVLCDPFFGVDCI